jgi:hypothetical protein
VIADYGFVFDGLMRSRSLDSPFLSRNIEPIILPPGEKTFRLYKVEIEKPLTTDKTKFPAGMCFSVLQPDGSIKKHDIMPYTGYFTADRLIISPGFNERTIRLE